MLELGYNRITSISGLHLRGLCFLKVLTLENNEITKVDGLSQVLTLQQLVLTKNKIKRIDARSFSGLTELRGLQLEENGLRTLANLGPLLKLRSLFLAFNRLSELTELDHILPERACPGLQEITVRNNPLSRRHLYRPTLVRKLPSLTVIDGKEVTFEEREKTEQMFSGADLHQSPLYYLCSEPRVEKVPIRIQSLTLTGFGLDNSGPPGFMPSTQVTNTHIHTHVASMYPIGPTHKRVISML